MMIFYNISACIDCSDKTKELFEAGKKYAEENGIEWKFVALTSTDKLDQYRAHKLPKKTKIPVWVDTETNKVWKKTAETKSKKASKQSSTEE